MSGPIPPQKLCPSCGANQSEDANICSQCGYNFNLGPYAQPPGQSPPGSEGANPNWHAYPRYGYDQQVGSASSDGFAIAGLVLGILSLPLMCVCYLSIPAGILALIMGGLGLRGRNRTMALVGMILGGAAILLTIALLIAFFAFGQSLSKSPLG